VKILIFPFSFFPKRIENKYKELEKFPMCLNLELSQCSWGNSVCGKTVVLNLSPLALLIKKKFEI